MTNLQIYPPQQMYITIPSTDGIPIPEQDLDNVRKIITKAKNSNTFYSENGKLKSKYINDRFLLYTPVTIDDDNYITIDGFIATLTADSTLWMSSSTVDLNQLYSQFVDAKGEVLILGLGLGALAVLVASKKEVTSVTVVEHNPKVIDMFNQQQFNMDKITIVETDVFSYTGVHDVVLCDYYNVGNKTSTELQELIENDIKLISNNITSKNFNFYGWELVYSSFFHYNTSPLVKRSEQEYVTLKKVHNSFDITNDLEKAIISVNNQTTLPKYFTNDYLTKKFNKAKKLVKNEFSHIITSDLTNDYAIYRVGDMDILAYGVTWCFNDKVYSAKVSNNKITDLYEIYKDKRSAEIDKNTLKPIYIYEIEGANKTDLDGNTVQVNHRVNSLEDLPIALYSDLRINHFPYINNIFYWAEKPYGVIVEFSYEGV